jgi:transcriptional regulator with PAS, ATPase and Fis domain
MVSSQFSTIIGQSAPMQALLEKVEKIAASPTATVLIRGESGTGKELIARGIHVVGPKAQGPFIELNCASIPDMLLEAELFGYEMGAFTDARSRKKGLLELANHGTIFLDEIDSLSVNLQAKLLKIIDDKIFRRLGGIEEIRVDVRIIAATNANLEDAITAQRFREDLYYRLNVMTIELPPLRERDGDVFLLAQYFIDRYNKEYGKRVKGLATSAASLIKAYPWPGNVRELKNVIERAVLLETKEYLEAEDLVIDRRARNRKDPPESPEESKAGAAFDPSGASVPTVYASGPAAESIVIRIPEQGISFEEVEKRFLEESLKMTRWNVRRAARLLNMSYDAFRYRMQKHGLR